ncbi:MAG: hypothetical protein O4805_05895, partial [Trichodesmium sp. St16_bin2-tuft]|nr:hypothetical protein [Trichodesmium sp. St16_bin2-tuft]
SISISAEITESGDGLLVEFLAMEFVAASIVNKFSMIWFKLSIYIINLIQCLMPRMKKKYYNQVKLQILNN